SPIFMWLPRCCCQAVGRAVHAVRSEGAAPTPLCGSPARGRKGCSRGRALHAVRSGGAAPTPLCGSPARGGKGGSLGVLGTPFAARARLLPTAVGPCPRGEGLFPGGAAPTDLCGSPALGANGAQRAPAQLCLKFGWRFSTKACMPSVWSAVAKIEWNTRRSKRTPSARLVSNTRLTHSLVIITLGSDLLAMTWAVFRVSSSSWSTGKILA